MVRKMLASMVLGGTLLLAGSSFDNGGVTPPAARAQKAVRHPHIRHALRELREARKELEAGEKIFGGHRAEALKAVDHAISQLQSALDFAERR
jgi:hypothetical protein